MEAVGSVSQCQRCGQEVPPRTRPGGTPKKFCSKRCKDAAWYADHQDEQREWRTANREQRCELMHQWYLANTERHRAATQRWAAANPERVQAFSRETARRWRAAHPEEAREAARKRRALKKGAAVVEQISLDVLFERDGRRCHICKKMLTRSKASVDHLVPLSHGGEHSWANVALAHRSCNSRRGAGRLPAQLRLVG
jgi:5-methylcytosine-specific restriction endonuclease McrA